MTHALSASLQLHRASLREAFGAWLLEAGPTSVLDVGAGSGELVAQLCRQGVQAEGIEADPAAVATARAAGRAVDRGSAWPLPHGDGAVDWVTLRHVLHHMTVPARAVREALRVARVGVLVAEPLCWSALPAHLGAAQLERLTRDLDRRAGMVHGPDLAPAELVAMIPADWSVEVRVHAPLVRLGPGDVDALVERARRGQRLLPSDAELVAELRASAASGLVCAPGTVIVRALRPTPGS